MTDKDLIQNALIIIQQELQIDSEQAWDFINHFGKYKEWAAERQMEVFKERVSNFFETHEVIDGEWRVKK